MVKTIEATRLAETGRQRVAKSMENMEANGKQRRGRGIKRRRNK
jgi:hypothetical protein